jgi:type VI secretion system protein ImpH
MAGPGRQTPDHLIEELAKNPFRFDFFRAVRLLENQLSDNPRIARIGSSSLPSQDPIRFAQNPTLAFAPSTVEKLTRSESSGVPRLFIHFFGLFGPNGPLPMHITEYARERQMHSADHTLTAFVNVFNHRFASFFYRAWAANQKAVDMDRYVKWDENRGKGHPDLKNEPAFARYVASFFGLSIDSPTETTSSEASAKSEVPLCSRLYFAGRLAAQTRNTEGLEAILCDFFQIKTEIQTFVGRWLDLPTNSLCKVGDSPETGKIGVTTIVGSRVWECQLNFRIRFGPMKLTDFERMLPVTTSFERLKKWVRSYVGEHFFWDVQLVLKADEVPDTCLGQAGRLGWTTWMKTGPFTKDAEDVILNP